MSDDLIFFNGLNGATGGYDLPPMTGLELAGFIRGERPPENLAELRYRYELSVQRHLGLREGVNPLRIEETGWGVIFAHGADPAIAEALAPLIDHRRAQAGNLFRLFTDEGGQAYRPGESKQQFLTRHGVGPGPADPVKMPYYLLLVGNPQEIPYQFQYQLDVQYAVGRIHFDTPQEYAGYAAGVVAAEKGEVKRARRATFFAPANPDDRATNLSADLLAGPLSAQLAAAYPDWQADLIARDHAKARSPRCWAARRRPRRSSRRYSHGMAYPLGHSLQLPHQGVVCQDLAWPAAMDSKPSRTSTTSQGRTSRGRLTGRADRLLLRLLRRRHAAARRVLAARLPPAFADRAAPLVAQLPAKLLSYLRGGALAVIGHVERAWGYSFSWPGAAHRPRSSRARSNACSKATQSARPSSTLTSVTPNLPRT